jgi:hypothetical protein
MRERTSVRALLKDLRGQVPEFLAALRSLPALLQRELPRAPPAPPPQSSPEMAELLAELRAARRRHILTLGAAALALALSWLALHSAAQWPGWTMFGAGLLTVGWGLRR